MVPVRCSGVPACPDRSSMCQAQDGTIRMWIYPRRRNSSVCGADDDSSVTHREAANKGSFKEAPATPRTSSCIHGRRGASCEDIEKLALHFGVLCRQSLL